MSSKFQIGSDVTVVVDSEVFEGRVVSRDADRLTVIRPGSDRGPEVVDAHDCQLLPAMISHWRD